MLPDLADINRTITGFEPELALGLMSQCLPVPDLKRLLIT